MLMERVPCDLSSLFSLTRCGTVPEFSTFWIENLLIPYPIGGNARKPMEERALTRLGTPPAGRTPHAMRVMFFTWLVLIATGLVFYSVIGLAHN
jgi:hypothetical protein